MFKIPLLSLYAVTLGDSILWREGLTSCVQCMHIILSSLSQMFERSIGQKETHMQVDQKS